MLSRSFIRDGIFLDGILKAAILVLGGFGLCYLFFLRTKFALSSGIESLVAYVPDDAFYYLVLARNKVQFGVWTFDGLGPATGFHLLHGYVLFLIYKFFGEISFDSLFLLVTFCSSVTIVISWVTISFFSISRVRLHPVAILGLLVPFLSPAVLAQGTSMMESWLVILMGSALLLFFNCGPSNTSKVRLPGQLTLAFFIGLLGSFARSDFGLFPASLVLSSWLIRIVSRSYRQRNLEMALIGAVAGVLMVSVHHFSVSGEFAQASARVKLYWTEVIGADFGPIIGLSLHMFWSAFPGLAFHLKSFLVAAFGFRITQALMRIREKSFQVSFRQSVILNLLLGSLLCIFGYVLLYRYNSQALQNWYSSVLVVPSALIIGIAWSFIFGRYLILLGVYLIFNAYTFALGQQSVRLWPNQVSQYRAALEIKTDFSSGELIGAWNAGVLSFFSEKYVINLDGLVNDRLVPFIKKNELVDFLKQERITRIVDFGEMFLNENLRRRGGYLDSRVDRCIAFEKEIGVPSIKWGNSILGAYTVDQSCL
jgi:hypothetical protein